MKVHRMGGEVPKRVRGGKMVALDETGGCVSPLLLDTASVLPV
jgi:hypothetical protein